MKSERVELGIDSVEMEFEFEGLDGWFDREYYFKQCLQQVDSILQGMTKCLQGELERSAKQVSTSDELIMDNLFVQIKNTTIRLVCPGEVRSLLSVHLCDAQVCTVSPQQEPSFFARQSREQAVHRRLSVSEVSLAYQTAQEEEPLRLFRCGLSARLTGQGCQGPEMDGPMQVMAEVHRAEGDLPGRAVGALVGLVRYIQSYSDGHKEAIRRRKSLGRPRRSLEETVQTAGHRGNVRRWFRYLVHECTQSSILWVTRNEGRETPNGETDALRAAVSIAKEEDWQGADCRPE